MIRLVASKRLPSGAGPGQADLLANQLAIDSQQLGLDLPAQTRATLVQYIQLIARWNKVHNLTAVRDLAAMVTHHLLDSLAVVPALKRHCAQPSCLVDVGSGAGLPGIVLAIVWPETQVYLVEPANKKAAFLRQATTTLNLSNVTVLAQRVQTLSRDSFESVPDLIVCRAYTALADFAEQCQALVGPETIIAAMKGPRARQEIDEFNRRTRQQTEDDSDGSPGEANFVRSLVSSCEEIEVPRLGARRFLVVLGQEVRQSLKSEAHPKCA